MFANAQIARSFCGNESLRHYIINNNNIVTRKPPAMNEDRGQLETAQADCRLQRIAHTGSITAQRSLGAHWRCRRNWSQVLEHETRSVLPDAQRGIFYLIYLVQTCVLLRVIYAKGA